MFFFVEAVNVKTAKNYSKRKTSGATMKLTFVACLTAALFASSYADAAYYRLPSIQQNQLVFTAEGDLWLSSVNGSEAKRLTTHAAEENQALFTPDGKAVVYVAAYDDTPDIYYLKDTVSCCY